MPKKRAIVVTLLLILAAGTTNPSWTQSASTASDLSSHRETPARHELSVGKDHNELLADVAGRIPGFGGVYISDGGRTLNAYLTDDSDVPEKRGETQQALEEIFDIDPGLRLNIIKGNYTVKQLCEWYELMEAGGVWDQPGVFMTDLDEANNKLFVGVTTQHDIAAVEAFLDQTPIPRKAVIIEVVEQLAPAR